MAHTASTGRWDVYLSYARPTRTLARAITKFLRSAGLRVWFDEDCVPARQGWLHASQDAIARSRYHIVLLADASPALWQRAVFDFADQSMVRYPHLETVPLIRPGYDESDFEQWLTRFEPSRLPQDKTKIDQSLRALMARVKGGNGQTSRPAKADLNPYPGLRPFGLGAGRYFFGRDAELAEGLQRLGEQPGGDFRRWLRIEGPTGVGKSSLARAGVVPAVVRGAIHKAPGDWLVAALRPSAHPVESLSAALARAFSGLVRASDVRETLHRASGLTDLISEFLPADKGLLLVLDHLDDVATEANGRPEEVTHFDTLLAEALDDFDQRLFLVTTGRSDLIPWTLDSLPRMAALTASRAAVIEISGLHRDALYDVVGSPAALIGQPWPSDLIHTLVDEAERVPNCTAKLCWILSTLAELPNPTVDILKGMGGVANALTRGLDNQIDALGSDDLERARNLLTALVSGGRGRVDYPLAITYEEALLAAGNGPRAQSVLDRLESGEGSGHSTPLIQVTRDGDSGDQVDHVRLAHSVLLRIWPRLRDWIAEIRTVLERRSDVDLVAFDWMRSDKPADGLPQGPKLSLLRGLDLSDWAQERLRSTMRTETRHFVEAAEKAEVERAEVSERQAANEAKQQAIAIDDERATLKKRISRNGLLAGLLFVAFVGASGAAIYVWRQAAELRTQVDVANLARREVQTEISKVEENKYTAEALKKTAEVKRRESEVDSRKANLAEQQAERFSDELVQFTTDLAVEADKIFRKIPAPDGPYARRHFAKNLIARIEARLVDSPDNTRLQYLLAYCHLIRGDLSADGASLKDTRSSYEKAIEILDKLAQNEGAKRSHLDALVRAHTNLADFLASPKKSVYGDTAAAVDHHKKAIELYARLTKTYPDETSYQEAFITAHRQLGVGLAANKDYNDARKAFEKAIELTEAMGNTKQAQLILATLWRLLGDMEATRRKYRQAVEDYQKSHDILEPLSLTDGDLENAYRRIRRKLKQTKSSL